MFPSDFGDNEQSSSYQASTAVNKTNTPHNTCGVNNMFPYRTNIGSKVADDMPTANTRQKERA